MVSTEKPQIAYYYRWQHWHSCKAAAKLINCILLLLCSLCDVRVVEYLSFYHLVTHGVPPPPPSLYASAWLHLQIYDELFRRIHAKYYSREKAVELLIGGGFYFFIELQNWAFHHTVFKLGTSRKIQWLRSAMTLLHNAFLTVCS